MGGGFGSNCSLALATHRRLVGTYVVVGPEHDPNQFKRPGVRVYRSDTNNRFFGLRLIDSD
ncbi:hypothetical protein [Botrimarina colliarenosi]|uniref:hypothetical protein n=1 Tax=Botrimarina colliarenosi TaxID=2528001 RepID=UPI0011B54579|nr:hypothetical protein [Botrimarina colliarenosi]